MNANFTVILNVKVIWNGILNVVWKYFIFAALCNSINVLSFKIEGFDYFWKLRLYILFCILSAVTFVQAKCDIIAAIGVAVPRMTSRNISCLRYEQRTKVLVLDGDLA